MKRLFVSVLLVLLFASASEAVIRWSQIPSCWVINCRMKYGAKCVACIQLNCGTSDANDPMATTWCNMRVPMPWQPGQDVPPREIPNPA